MTTIALQRSSSSKPVSRHPGNDELFSSLVRQYTSDLYRYAFWLSGKKDVAEDIVQETLIRAWKSVHKLNDSKAIKSWLFTIAKRESARRFERKQLKLSELPAEDLPEKHVHYDTSTEAFVLRQAIFELPKEYREPLLLQVVCGYTQKEIAVHLDISTAGAGTRLFRARQKLREALI